MPHLDLCTFAVQYNWTIFTFLALYFLVAVAFIPRIGTILHLRNKCSKPSEISTIKGSSAKTTICSKGLAS